MTLERNVQRLARKTFRQLDTPRSLAVYLLMEANEWVQLVNMRCDPYSYEPFFFDGVDKYRRDCQATELLRKYEAIPTGIDTSRCALETFYQAEAQNTLTTLRLSCHLDYPVFDTAVQWRADALFRKAQRWIVSVLGQLPDVLDGRFGPGATFESAKWRLSDGIVAYDKLHFEPCVSSSASGFVDHLVWETALGASWEAAVPSRLIAEVPGNRFTTVPKDATKDRGIAIEPGVNVVGQLAIGAAIRRRLNRVGIDLVNGQDLHRRYARDGSVHGNLSTVDLSNASDTICIALVRLLLPPEWFELLDALRSPFSNVPTLSTGKNEWVKLRKFSSMGNGFTFELETLLFCALIHAAGGHIGVDSFVYGDDMIIPSDITPDVIALLKYSGFTPNDRKTFVTGHFRESCGGDYFNGQDVRPYYLKKEPHEPSDWLSIANGLYAASRSLELPELLASRNNALDNVPVTIRRCRGPQALGDLVVHDEESTWSFTTRSSIRYFRVWRPVVRLKLLYAIQRSSAPCALTGKPVERTYSKPLARYRPGVHIAAALMGLPSEGLAPRNSVGGYRFGRVAWS